LSIGTYQCVSLELALICQSSDHTLSCLYPSLPMPRNSPFYYGSRTLVS
jgi:hypothetical protein